MAACSLSARAASDLEGIFEYTIDNFGLDQARSCLWGLHERFGAPGLNPMLGRDAGDLAPGREAACGPVACCFLSRL